MGERSPMFICEHGRRDDEDCNACLIVWEQMAIVDAQKRIDRARETIAELQNKEAAR